MDERLRKELLRSELKERNKGKKIIRCKYRPKYPDSAERECICVNRKGSRMATLRIEVNWKIKFQSIHPKNWNLVLQNIS